MKKRNVSIIMIFKYIFPKIIKICPIYFIFYCISDILQGLSIGINTYLMQRFFDLIVDTIKLNSSQYSDVYLFATFIGIFMITYEILDGIANFMYRNMINKLTGYMNYEVNQKSHQLDAILFEDNKKLDVINKAFEGSKRCINLVFSLISMLMFHMTYLTFMTIYLYRIQPTLAILLYIIFIPMGISQFLKSSMFLKMEDHSAPVRRQVSYYEKAISDIEYFKETRILGIFEFLNDRYLRKINKLNQIIWKTEKKNGLIEFYMRLVTLFGYLVIFVLIVYYVINGIITIGEFSAIFTSIGVVFSIMKDVVDRNLSFMARNIAYTRNFMSFIQLPNKIKSVESGKKAYNDIKFKNVYFQYPNADDDALKNINFTINKNETLAIVGENGAGKSTFVKLLMGLYQPTQGDIYVAGTNTKEATSYRYISAVFQNFIKYKLTVKENISISDTSKNIETQENVLSKVGINLESNNLPNGINTILSTEFGGIDLSGGQWQKIAIARGLYRSNEIIILDEPTAAIDPIEETFIYNKFIELSHGKTAIIVTHRLGSVRIADRIIVMDNGQIIESGSHMELMKKKGKYALMYNSQADWYLKT